MGVLHTLLDAVQLQARDRFKHLVAQRVVRDGHQAAEQGRRENLQQRLAQGLGDFLGLGGVRRVLADVGNQLGTGIGGQQDQGVLEVDHPAFAVFHHALVEHLEENLVHVRVSFLHLIEQHHAVGFAPYRFGQHTAFAVADIARRCALEGGHGVGFLELAHVDGDHVLLAAVHGFGQGQGGFGLAHTGGAGQHEHANRLARVVEAGAGGLDALGDHLQGMVLADDAFLQVLVEVEHSLQLIAGHAAHRDAGPVGDHRGHGLVIHGRQDQRGFALQSGEALLQIDQFCTQFIVAAVHNPGLLAQGCAGGEQLIHQGFLFGPTAFQRGQTLTFGGQQRFAMGLTRSNGNADRMLTGDDLQLGFQGFDTATAVVHFRGDRVQADGDAGAGGVQQAHGLVRQLARRNVAVGELHRGFQSFVEDLHLVVFFHCGSHAAHHQQGLVFRRLGNLYHLETAGQGRVFLDVLFVLGPRGGSHGTQGATGQGRLEQVGRVTGAGSATGTHQGMGFVDKQDDRLG